jgi:hypothetical protein
MEVTEWQRKFQYFIIFTFCQILLGWSDRPEWLRPNTQCARGIQEWLQVLVWEHEGRRPCGTLRRRWNNSINTDLKRGFLAGVDCVKQSQKCLTQSRWSPVADELQGSHISVAASDLALAECDLTVTCDSPPFVQQHSPGQKENQCSRSHYQIIHPLRPCAHPFSYNKSPFCRCV